jgi:hypothetical protein
MLMFRTKMAKLYLLMVLTAVATSNANRDTGCAGKTAMEIVAGRDLTSAVHVG